MKSNKVLCRTIKEGLSKAVTTEKRPEACGSTTCLKTHENNYYSRKNSSKDRET